MEEDSAPCKQAEKRKDWKPDFVKITSFTCNICKLFTNLLKSVEIQKQMCYYLGTVGKAT